LGSRPYRTVETAAYDLLHIKLRRLRYYHAPMVLSWTGEVLDAGDSVFISLMKDRGESDTRHVIIRFGIRKTNFLAKRP
jgi:hypothetical protein